MFKAWKKISKTSNTKSTEDQGPLHGQASSIFQSSNEALNKEVDEQLEIAVLAVKHCILADAMRDFYMLFADSPQDAPSKGASQECQNKTGQLAAGTRKSQRRSGKGIDSRTAKCPSDDDEGGMRRQKRKLEETMQEKKFACPLFKKWPEFFYANLAHGRRCRACLGPGFKTVAQLK